MSISSSNPAGCNAFRTTPGATSLTTATHARFFAPYVAALAFYLSSAFAFITIYTAGTITFTTIFITVFTAAVTPVTFP